MILGDPRLAEFFAFFWGLHDAALCLLPHCAFGRRKTDIIFVRYFCGCIRITAMSTNGLTFNSAVFQNKKALCFTQGFSEISDGAEEETRTPTHCCTGT